MEVAGREMVSMLPTYGQETKNEIERGDYKDEEGLICCGVCGRRKQFRMEMPEFGISKIVPCICKCQADEIEQKKKQDAYEQHMHDLNRLKDSSMMASKFRDASFEKYTIREENREIYKLARKYVKKFQKMKSENQGLLFYGPVGTGKSYTAACIANALMERSTPVIMTSFVKILQDIQGTGNEAQYIQILNSASLLIIDDLGAERSTDYALEKVYNIIDSRVRANKPMLLTTNVDLDDMLECEDIRYKRVYDRIFECCHPVQICGESFRQIRARRQFDETEKLLC